MCKIRAKFTKWYYKKGYYFGYDFSGPIRSYFICPWYVRPLLIFFSPSVYFMQKASKFGEWFRQGLEEGLKETLIKKGED